MPVYRRLNHRAASGVAVSAICRSSAHNFVGRAIDGYEAPRCLLTQTAAAAVANVARDLAPRGLLLKVFDCYRPTRAVADFSALGP